MHQDQCWSTKKYSCKKTCCINLERYMTNSWWIQHLCGSAHSAKSAEGFRSTVAEMRTKVPYSLRRLRVPAKSMPDNRTLHFFINSNWIKVEFNCIPISTIRPWNATCERAHARPYRKLFVWPLQPMNTAADKECIRTSVYQQLTFELVLTKLLSDSKIKNWTDSSQ